MQNAEAFFFFPAKRPEYQLNRLFIRPFLYHPVPWQQSGASDGKHR